MGETQIWNFALKYAMQTFLDIRLYVEQHSVLKHLNWLFDHDSPPDSPPLYIELSTDRFSDKWIE